MDVLKKELAQENIYIHHISNEMNKRKLSSFNKT